MIISTKPQRPTLADLLARKREGRGAATGSNVHVHPADAATTITVNGKRYPVVNRPIKTDAASIAKAEGRAARKLAAERLIAEADARLARKGR